MTTDTLNSINKLSDPFVSMTPANTNDKKGLWRKGVLVQIQGGVWSMETKLTPDDLNMGRNQIPGFATLGKKRLLDPKYKNQFLNIVN